GTVGNGTTPVSGILVTAYDSSTGSYGAGAVTNGSGQYSLSVPAGSYRVDFYDPGLVYVEQGYGGGNGTAITVGPNATGKDATLVAGVLLSGTITRSVGGTTVQGARISVYEG